jgi:hypothetical protein
MEEPPLKPVYFTDEKIRYRSPLPLRQGVDVTLHKTKGFGEIIEIKIRLPHGFNDTVIIGVDPKPPFPPGDNLGIFPLALESPGQYRVRIHVRRVRRKFLVTYPNRLIVINPGFVCTVPGFQIPADPVILQSVTAGQVRPGCIGGLGKYGIRRSEKTHNNKTT